MFRPRLRSLSAALVVLSTASACAEPDLPVTATVTDSSGIEIVTSTEPVWGDGSPWTSSPEPILSIGAADGDEAYTLFRITSAKRLTDGRLVLVSSGTSQLRLYDAAGVHLVDVGRAGDGPGEFRALRGVWQTRGDSLLTSDSRLSRLTVFDRNGVFGRTISVPPGGDVAQIFGSRPFDNGDLLIQGVVRPPEGPRAGLFPSGWRVFDRYSPEGSHIARVGRATSGQNWGFTIPGRGQAYTVAPFNVYVPPHATDGHLVYIGDPMEPEVSVYDGDGGLIRIVRWAFEPPPVTSEHEERYIEERTTGASSPEARALMSAGLEGIVFPERLPVYQGLRVDSEGYLWVEQYRPTWDPARKWWVFDPEGRWLGEGPLPSGLNVQDIGADYFLGLHQDDLGVERVLMYSFDRN